MIYVQRKDRTTKQLETVDEFDTNREARKMLTEYRIADHYGEYYLSRRACKDWNDSTVVDSE